METSREVPGGGHGPVYSAQNNTHRAPSLGREGGTKGGRGWMMERGREGGRKVDREGEVGWEGGREG